MVACWSFEEDSGTRYDSYSTYDLTDNNTVDRASGKIGYAASFEQTNNEYLSLTSGINLADDTPYTIAFWAYRTSDTTRGSFTSGVSSSTRGFGGMFRLTNTTGNMLEFNVGMSNNTWFFIVVSSDGTISNVSYNNIDKGTQTHSDNNIAQEIINIGLASSYYHDGLIDEMVIWEGRQLTSDEITELFNGGSGKSCDSLIVLPTSTSTITPTPTVTPTPSGYRELDLPSGNYFTIKREATYGDAYVGCFLGLLIIILLLAVFVRHPRLWLR